MSDAISLQLTSSLLVRHFGEHIAAKRHAMRVVYYIREISLRGGVKVLAQHVRLLRERGIDAELLSLGNEFQEFYPDAVVIEGENDRRLNADVCVATRPGDVPFMLKALRGKKTALCHFFQGDEIGDFQSRIDDLRKPKRPVTSALDRLVHQLKLYRRIKRFDKIYRLPTIKMAVSKHLCRLIESRYQQECIELANAVDLSVFKPVENQFSATDPWRLVSVGPMSTAFKGLKYVFGAVAMFCLRDRSPPKASGFRLSKRWRVVCPAC